LRPHSERVLRARRLKPNRFPNPEYVAKSIQKAVRWGYLCDDTQHGREPLNIGETPLDMGTTPLNIGALTLDMGVISFLSKLHLDN